MTLELSYVGSDDNDLVRVAGDAGLSLQSFDDMESAVAAASTGAAVLMLADDYPRPSGRVNADLLTAATEKHLRLYLEYPEAVAGLNLGTPQPTQWERAAVASRFFAPDLDPDRILALHGCWYRPVEAPAGELPLPNRVDPNCDEPDRIDPDRIDPDRVDPGRVVPHLVVARLAGYHRAVYGLPDDAAPLLFEWGDRILVATTKLSQFVTARYGPTPAWQSIWGRILAWLLPEATLPPLRWQPAVELTADAHQALPADAESTAFARSARWFRDHVVYSIDWKKGAIEGFEAGIDHQGRQLKRAWPRGDCTGETAMLFAWDWAVHGDPSARQRAGQLLDYVLSSPDFYHDEPTDPAYGLTNWFERGPVFYGDDNARVLMPALTVARLVDDDRWDERILRSVLANLRTTGSLGFRRPRLDLQHLHDNGGWTFFRDEAHIHYAPHYQAYLWATFLMAHALTGDDELLSKPRNAIAMTMAAYPDEWRWTNGIAQEMARMLLPLSFLVRVDDTAEHRGWLRRMCDDLLALMQPCGALGERLGELGQGAYGPPQTNEAYGTSEATLIQENGDPACDLLYTTNFAYLGLHEAAAVSGDADLTQAAGRLTDFLCRIQVRSQAQPYLDGAWMRSFDFELWEYWGSSADLGWGAWSVESGWTNTWIASVLAMRQLGETLFDTSLRDRLAPRWPALREEMFDAGRPQRLTPAAVPVTGSAPGAE